jgi:hypothetical protein
MTLYDREADREKKIAAVEAESIERKEPFKLGLLHLIRNVYSEQVDVQWCIIEIIVCTCLRLSQAVEDVLCCVCACVCVSVRSVVRALFYHFAF